MGDASAHIGPPPLIGRDAELAALRAAVARPPMVAFVEGEAGIGKTRLVTELDHVVLATCQPLPDPFPYGALLDCLSQCGNRLRDPGPVTGALRDHLPELADHLPAAPRPLGDPEAERHRMFRAIRELLGSLGPAVLVVDDLHWADAQTCQVLRFVIANPLPELSIVATYRPEELAEQGPLGRTVRVPPGVTRMDLALRPFDSDGVRSMVNAMVGTTLTSDEFAGALLHETAGIPYLVEETVRALRDPKREVRAGTATARRVLAEVGIPVLVRETAQERMRSLPAAARSIAEAAAVLGVAESIDTLGAVAGGADLDQMITLVRSSVLVEHAANHYAFRHPLAARAVRESLPGPWRNELHVRAIRVLSELDRTPHARVAAHAKAVGMTDEWLRYSEMTADAAAEAHDVPTAIDLLCELIADRNVRPRDVNRLASKLCGNALTGLHNPAVLSRVEDLLSDPRLASDVRGDVHLWFGLLLLRETGESDRARAEITHAMDLLGDQPERIARGMAVLAVPYLCTAPIAEHQAWLDRVEDLLDHLPTRALRTAVLATTLGGRLVIGDPSTWQRTTRLPSPAETTEPDEICHLARAHCNLADACAWIGHYQRARTYLRTGLTLAARVGAPYVIGTAEATAVRLDWLTGDWPGLDERIAELVKTYAHLPPLITELNLAAAWLATARGDWAQAERGFRTALDSHATIPVQVAAAGGMAGLLLGRGETAAAERHAERGVAMIRSKEAWVWAGDVVPQAVDCHLARGRVDAADDLVAEMADGLSGTDAPHAQAALAACHARLAPADDGTLYRTAIDLHRGLGLTYRATQLTEQAAHTASPDTAVLASLAEAYDGLGATVDAARCRHIIRSVGVPTPSHRGRRGYGDQLSPREQDIARLVVSGHTNREIAQALFISRRTVEEYVAKVCRKLNAASRNDIRIP
ncbi:helix-turn-helix transcriptional regulator [Actinosynnema sp. ALI-1.44]|uniref:helix-turn-helix transcriptional regulator n=1 Tax=Actinosynnema sp. ALI-1.44 TaxID=1933779 RepID=UPI00097BD939|nr:LuxR family transcriptional regulator [Actinosynnema sp. ALI-1.44]ONI81684.1 helix-turn-helix transcriptional regulator [Actinosynnema sp. ALI-1.44]